MSSSAYPVIWALKHAPVVDAEERAIVLALADHGDADGCNCFPSVATMARCALVSPSTVKRKLRALKARGVIRPQVGPAPARWLAMPAHLRTTVYELMIPYSWWSDAQREEVNRMREERGRPPLTPVHRPDLAPAPPKKTRADKGKPAPQRRPKSAPPKKEDKVPPVSKTGGSEPVDNSPPPVSKTGDPRSLRPGTPGLQDPQPSCSTLLSNPPEKTACDLSSRSAQVGDARTRVTTPQAANEDNGTNNSHSSPPRPSERPQSGEEGRGDQRGAPVADRGSRRRSASQEARRVLGALPRAFRDGAAPWVLAEMAVRIDAMLVDGRTPAEIVRAAEEIAGARPIGDRDHIDALRAVRAALRANAYDHEADDGTDRCQGCGARRTGAVPCASCDPVEVIDVIETCPACYEAAAIDGGLCANCSGALEEVG